MTLLEFENFEVVPTGRPNFLAKLEFNLHKN